jgi:hypothetical protein
MSVSLIGWVYDVPDDSRLDPGGTADRQTPGIASWDPALSAVIQRGWLGNPDASALEPVSSWVQLHTGSHQDSAEIQQIAKSQGFEQLLGAD